jgi:hypothetical protein
MQRLKNWHLFAVCVAVWSTTWHAITYQIGPVAPEVGVALRFGLAGAFVLGICAARGVSLRLPAIDHLRLAVQGAFLYGVSYICVYHAERWVPSGLVAVGYSASPLIAGFGARAAYGAPLSRRFLLGGAIGLAGVALIFWPELSATQTTDATLRGVAFTVAAVLSLAYLALAGSVLAFACFHRSRGPAFRRRQSERKPQQRPWACLLACHGHWHALWGRRLRLDCARTGAILCAARDAVLVAVAGLLGPGRVGVGLCLFSESAEPSRPRARRNGGRDDADTRAPGLIAARRLSAELGYLRWRPARTAGQLVHPESDGDP